MVISFKVAFSARLEFRGCRINVKILALALGKIGALAYIQCQRQKECAP